MAFCSASVKLHPNDIASPPDFIVVVSVSSAAGNFSGKPWHLHSNVIDTGSPLESGSPVMSFSISSSRYTTASKVVTLAIGTPVAFEASAEDRDTRQVHLNNNHAPVCGSIAIWILQPLLPGQPRG